MKAFARIFLQFTDDVEGSYEKLAGTATHNFDIIQAQFGDLSDAVTMELTPAFTKAYEVVGKFFKTLNEQKIVPKVSAEIKSFTSDIRNVIAALLAVPFALASIRTAIGAFALSFAKIAGPLKIILGVGSIIYLLKDKLKDLSKEKLGFDFDETIDKLKEYKEKLGFDFDEEDQKKVIPLREEDQKKFDPFKGKSILYDLLKGIESPSQLRKPDFIVPEMLKRHPGQAATQTKTFNQTNNLTINAPQVTDPHKIVAIIRTEQEKWVNEMITNSAEFNRVN